MIESHETHSDRPRGMTRALEAFATPYAYGILVRRGRLRISARSRVARRPALMPLASAPRWTLLAGTARIHISVRLRRDQYHR